jgi:hypothetical protein
MDVVIAIAALALLVVVPILLWRMRRSRFARGLGDAGRHYNNVMGLGGAPPEPGVGDAIESSGPPRPRR